MVKQCKKSRRLLQKKFTRIKNEEDGQSLVEFALTAPILLLFLVGIINFGFIMFTYLNMNITVQEASRLAGLGQSDCSVAQYTWDHLSLNKADKLVLNSCSADATTPDDQSLILAISPNDTTRKSGDYVTVTLSYKVKNLTPLFDQFLSSLKLTATSTIRVE
jgi:Flp pilus assembly protein TadG